MSHIILSGWTLSFILQARNQHYWSLLPAKGHMSLAALTAIVNEHTAQSSAERRDLLTFKLQLT